jgi:hypothetical protein
MTRHWISGAGVGAITVGVLWAATAYYGATARAEREPVPAPPVGGAGTTPPLAAIRSAEGKITVRLVRQDDASRRSEHTVQGVTAIEFYPGYILYHKKDGGQVAFPEKTWYFTWTTGAVP